MKASYLLLLAASLLLSCNESFLDVVPKSDVSSGNFYQNATDFRNAVNAAYSFLQKDALYGDNFSSLAEVPADNVTVADPSGAGGAPSATIDAFVTPTTNALVLSVYTGSYAGIQRCNIVLERIGNAAIADNLKGQFTATYRSCEPCITSTSCGYSATYCSC